MNLVFIFNFIFIFHVKQDEQHHDMELNQELQEILDLINNMPDNELFDKQAQTDVDEILAPQSPSQSVAATCPRRVIYDPFSDDMSDTSSDGRQHDDEVRK